MFYRVGLPFWRAAARRGVTIAIPVQVFFDKDADVYFATSTHLRGLAVEAPTLDELRDEVRGAIDMLIEMEMGVDHGQNGGQQGQARPSFSFVDQPVAIA